MKATNRFSIHFKLRAERTKDGFAPVFLGLVVDGTKSYMALKNFQADTEHWDKIKGGGRKDTRQGRAINEYLDEVRMTIRGHYRDMELNGERITSDTLKDAFLGNVQDGAPIMFSELIAYHNEQALALLSIGTMRHYYVTQRYLIKFFNLKYKREDIALSALNYKFISDFEIFLHNHKPVDHQKPMDTNGVLKHLVRLKKMVNLAISLSWIEKDPFKGFKMKKKKVEKEFLNEWELESIERKMFKIERLAMVRDMFVFCCYTGLSYVDLMNLRPEHIVKGIDGEPWIKTFRQKTSIPVNTPLLISAQNILTSYAGNIRAISKGMIFPLLSNQKMNSYLKEIADFCGIKKNLTFHIARHTFATTITLSNGVPIETVSKMLGHTKIATTQIYARVLEKKVSDDMAILRKKLA
ncbi:Site-specific recombinase XerD [Mucilaginibacter sp. OK268]|uniref:site-specific integrase n=1 Tax=Mucilaginibacter sp. OK268 TaxID=1881048 RepID=UPI00089174A0|nr:site-specific integrase [Mucilaginibacter sp. OK268]SDP85960.1 Site-specific recombinase XerD [Mucilaginibacter sp. OK268]